MQAWQLQEAKAYLSEVVGLFVNEGPPLLTVRGKAEAVLLSKKDYERLTGTKPHLFDFMRASPFQGLDIICDRNQSLNRELIYEIFTRYKYYFRDCAPPT